MENQWSTFRLFSHGQPMVDVQAMSAWKIQRAQSFIFELRARTNATASARGSIIFKIYPLVQMSLDPSSLYNFLKEKNDSFEPRAEKSTHSNSIVVIFRCVSL